MPILYFRRARRTMTPIDPIDIPLYSLSQAARFVGVPLTTLQKWVHGRSYEARGSKQWWPNLIEPADRSSGRLSFANIAEAHILASTRSYRIPMADVRAAIDMARKDDASEHPLLSGKFYRSGKQIFVDVLSEKVAASKPIEGQRPLGDLLDDYLERITKRDSKDQPIEFFPVRRNDKKSVTLSFYVAGGQPVVSGTGILVEVIRDFHRAGLTVEEIADDYALDKGTVDEAIKYLAA